jgi:hypothetical protein
MNLMYIPEGLTMQKLVTILFSYLTVYTANKNVT